MLKKLCPLLFLLLSSSAGFAQKKPLNHNVYDSWEAVGAKQLSNNGLWAAYSILKQEGDGALHLQNLVTNAKINIARGTNLQFSSDSKYAALVVKPLFKDTRESRIKKKKPDDMTKDSLFIVDLANSAVTKVARIKSYKIPEKGTSLLAYLLEKSPDTSKKTKSGPAPATPKKDDAEVFAFDEPENKTKQEGTDLILKNLTTGTERIFRYVSDYSFNKNGKQMVFACTGSKKDKTAPEGVFLLNTEKGTVKTLVNGKGNFKNFQFNEEGEYLVFLGERSPEKKEIKDFNIYYNSTSLDTAQILVDNEIKGMPAKWAVSGDTRLSFSKDGNKLFFGIAPVKQPKDTTLVDFEHAKLDVWGYKDDYLQPMQLKRLESELKRSYLTAMEIFNSDPKVVPLTDLKLPEASPAAEGNANFVLASTDYGNRIQSQWTGSSIKDYYLVDTKTGARKKIIEGLSGFAVASPAGKYILYFDKTNSNWYAYNVQTAGIVHLNKGLAVKFVEEDNDVPDEPGPYGAAAWAADDKAVLIYDRYDIWEFSPEGKAEPQNITNGFGRQNKITFRYQKTDPESKFLEKRANIWLSAFNNTTKENGFYKKNIGDHKNPELVVMEKMKYSDLGKAKDAERYIFDKGSYVNSPDVYVSADMKAQVKLSNTNPQQQNYNWGTAALVKWTTPKGFNAEGILYKPEDFDPAKKYPMIVYFYEKLSEGLYAYNAPAPTPSRLNIPYFVSNGYLVFAPDISYEKGYPGKSAEEFINSGVESLKKNTWVDGTKIGIQGQSWGGYQVAHLITRTNMYAAAWAGAPVVNMTSAYGGMRWESGMNRQFQYEKTQSRIGATLWEKPELYIENSPLFKLPNVKTPVVIMANDADGAVPWYQGIEMFTGLRRLGKPVWMLNYNNEAHNLMQRQNRKDIQIREQQFFDYYLKEAKAPVWMVNGIPATEKGKTWGFELTDEKP
ncbi:dipeptidyl aminopeptidase/acylaminoacyl peptidase [Pedobacter africanus]|uniref:Dipeptidyl aminopeptidase/acylaminoacyl peptidase n=1 Tax=Pedobacter africanus TaxID=151894 RepID=A0ACC6KRD4_9SPHI|nr:prolyl oligopeptidase family serine peptidase [Pedobacter africanus]MDR6781666.1 dipeptidyl aminopeptidase/acylaminoacyl peptidase [Pedobacter africanus]